MKVVAVALDGDVHVKQLETLGINALATHFNTDAGLGHFRASATITAHMP